MPLTWELTAEIKDWLTPRKLRALNEGWRTQGTGFSDEVIEDLNRVLVRNDLHYENILGHLETHFRRQQRSAQEYHSLYSWLVELVYHLLYYRQVNNDALFERQLPYYQGLVTLAKSNRPLWVFSLNHDLLVEAIAARSSIPLYCGFSSKTVLLPCRDTAGKQIGELKAEILTRGEVETAAMYFPNPLQEGIYLLKLRGALDVFTFNDGQDLLKLLPAGPGPRGVFQALRAANEHLIYPSPGSPGGRAKAVNEIAYADANGEMQFLRRSLLAGAYKFDARRTQVLPQSLLKHFHENLNFVSELVCLGYGFGDSHINDIVRAWLEHTEDRRLVIVSPHAQEIPTPFRHLAPQISTAPQQATEWLDSTTGTVRSRIETLRKRAFDHIRSLTKQARELELSEFTKHDQARIVSAVAEKIRNRTLASDGARPIAGDRQEASRRLAEELGGTEEDLLLRMIEFFESRSAAW